VPIIPRPYTISDPCAWMWRKEWIQTTRRRQI